MIVAKYSLVQNLWEATYSQTAPFTADFVTATPGFGPESVTAVNPLIPITSFIELDIVIPYISIGIAHTDNLKEAMDLHHFTCTLQGMPRL